MTRTVLFLTAFLVLCTTSAASVNDDLAARRQEAGTEKCFEVLDREGLSKEERDALEFLYAYMPLPDIADYSGDFWLRQVRSSLQARKETAWGGEVPDSVWRHFVLPVRVNNEDLDLSREAFYSELKDRVRGMSMAEAALEVNHWCHEKVTYTPSDSRTSAPLATLRSAIGRCGEESTFTVAAMRSVGIPARQVYTPRWAHTDDNHAWVEIWADGKWHFLGACEPEAVLDLGWFNAPASRGMLMHTKVFGRYEGQEETVSRNNCYTEINVTQNYAPVGTATVRVVDTDGNPVSGAKVMYKLYNYAEFYTLATKYTDETGRSSFTAGCGDLLVWAVKDGHFGLAKLSVGRTAETEVTLDKTEWFTGSLLIDIRPPRERNTIPYQTEKQIQENKRRLAQEDSIRGAYTSTFHHGSVLEEKARGNHATIEAFLTEHPTRKAELLLGSITDKDLRDCEAEVLRDHYDNTGDVTDSLSALYYMSPRISNERLTPFRSALKGREELSRYANDPEGLARWTRESIRTDSLWNPQSLCMSPETVFSLRVADPHSRDIFYVAAARSLGILSRIDEVTGKTQYMEGGEWKDVTFEETEGSMRGKGILRAEYKGTADNDNPKYYSHFTISRLSGCEPVLLNYPETGCDYESLLRDGESLDAGSYLLVTGTRLPDGGVLARLEFFPIIAGATTDISLVMRQSGKDVQVIGGFDSGNIYNDETEGRKAISSTTGQGCYVVGLIASNQEPTNHTLRDIAALRDEFEAWGGKVLLLFKDEDDKSRFTNRSDFSALPSTVVWGTDVDSRIYDQVRSGMGITSDVLPVFLVCDSLNRVVFMSQGYTIGLGEQIMGVVRNMERL